MHFPRDIKEGNRFVARAYEELAARVADLASKEPSLQGVPITRLLAAAYGSRLEPLGGLSILQDAPGFPEMLERLWSRAWPGCIAGDLLRNLLQLRAAGLDASVNKAIAIELDYLSTATTREGPHPGDGKSLRYVRDTWQEFKPSCHLWAAYRIWEAEREPESFNPFSEESIEGFLALSETIAKMALSLKSRGRSESLLDGGELWRVSRRYALPTATLDLAPLESWKLEVLRREFKSLRP